MDLHVGTLQPYITCLDIGNRYTNFLYQIHMKFLGNTWAGIVFRAADQNVNYLFSITPNGLYSLGVFPTETSSVVLAYGHSTAIHAGLNQDNTLAVIARDTGIALFINGQFVDSVQDNTLTQGAIGVYAGSLTGKPADVIFSGVKVWALS